METSLLLGKHIGLSIHKIFQSVVVVSESIINLKPEQTKCKKQIFSPYTFMNLLILSPSLSQATA